MTLYNQIPEHESAIMRAHEAQYGGYNDFPPNWEEITPEEFACSNFFVYGFVGCEYRQMIRHRDGTRNTMVSAHLFFHPQGCYAISRSSWTVRYFRFGCTHEWGSACEELQKRKISLDRFEHARFCPKCGTLQITDSSD